MCKHYELVHECDFNEFYLDLEIIYYFLKFKSRNEIFLVHFHILKVQRNLNIIVGLFTLF